MGKRYGIYIEEYHLVVSLWYSSPGKRMRAMATLRRRVVEDPSCKNIRFVEGDCLKLGVTYSGKKPKTFEFVTLEELDKARTKINKDRKVTSTFLVV